MVSLVLCHTTDLHQIKKTRIQCSAKQHATKASGTTATKIQAPIQKFNAIAIASEVKAKNPTKLAPCGVLIRLIHDSVR
jgi:hypothetical protein